MANPQAPVEQERLRNVSRRREDVAVAEAAKDKVIAQLRAENAALKKGQEQ